jgi:hypothetical protein
MASPAEQGGCRGSRHREIWRNYKLEARLPLAPVTVETKPISEQARTERTSPEQWALASARPLRQPLLT